MSANDTKPIRKSRPNTETWLWTGRLKNRSAILSSIKRFFSSPLHSNRFWGPPRLLPDRNHSSLPLGTKQLMVKLATHLHLVPTLRMHEVIPRLPPNVFISWCLIKLMTTTKLPNGKFYHNHTNSISYSLNNLYVSTILGARGRVAGWGTMLHARRSVLIPDEVTGSFNWPNPSSSTTALASNSNSNRNEYKESSWV
jgi:hypothetical protein